MTTAICDMHKDYAYHYDGDVKNNNSLHDYLIEEGKFVINFLGFGLVCIGYNQSHFDHTSFPYYSNKCYIFCLNYVNCKCSRWLSIIIRTGRHKPRAIIIHNKQLLIINSYIIVFGILNLKVPDRCW